MGVNEAVLAKILKLESRVITRGVITNPDVLKMVILDVFNVTVEVKENTERRNRQAWDISLRRNGQYIFYTMVTSDEYFNYCCQLAQTWIDNNKIVGIQEFLRTI